MGSVVFINDLSGGGAERVVTVLLRSIAMFHPTMLVTIGSECVYDLPKGQFRVVLSNKGGIIRAFLRLIKFYLAERPEVVQSHLNKANYLNCLMRVLFRYEAQIVHCVAYGASYKGSGLKGLANRVLGLSLFWRADLHVFKSRAMFVDYVETFKIKPKRYKIISNPYDFGALYAAAEGLNPFRKGAVAIVVVGRLVAKKQVAQILRALSTVSWDFDLHVLGDGPLRKELEKIAQRSGLGHCVHFHGFVDNPSLFYRYADIYISASRAEGFPNTLVEAMAFGCVPVHADCVSGPREIIAGEPGPVLLPSEGFERCEGGVLFPVGSDVELARGVNYVVESGWYRSEDARKKIMSRVCRYSQEGIVQEYAKLLRVSDEE